MLNNFGEKKKPFFTIRTKILDGPQNCIFPKGLTHAFGKKMPFFHYLFSLKIGLEPRFNNVLDRKETFFDYIKSLKKRIFPRGLTHAFGQEMEFFLSFVFVLNKRRNKV